MQFHFKPIKMKTCIAFITKAYKVANWWLIYLEDRPLLKLVIENIPELILHIVF